MAILIAVYVLAMVLANLLVWWLGPWFSPFNAFLLIGLDLTMRDVLHERVTRWQMLGIILAGGAITYFANPSAQMTAIASATAFTVAVLADSIVYVMMKRYPRWARINGSNVVGAAVDSVLFPTIAFGALMPAIIALQFVAKVAGGAVWSAFIPAPKSHAQ